MQQEGAACAYCGGTQSGENSLLLRFSCAYVYISVVRLRCGEFEHIMTFAQCTYMFCLLQLGQSRCNKNRRLVGMEEQRFRLSALWSCGVIRRHVNM